MHCVAELLRSLPWFRLALLAAIVVEVASCSSDTQRFSENPFASKNARPAGEMTSSIPSNPAGQIETTTLPPPPVAASTWAAPQTSPALSSTTRTPATRIATNAPIKLSTDIPAAPSASASSVHVVGSGETLSRIARRYHKSLTEIATANNIAPHSKLKVGDRLFIPGGRAPQASVTPPPRKVATNPKTNAAQLTNSAHKITPRPDIQAENKNVAAAAALSFRWPVRGRVIAGFGPKPSGQQNDGINLAVPEGTPIKAAEDGVVIYANNELKNYGNLVLVRHANGFVTAYAHASEILVKRDEPVRRGQVIAKSGQTGNVLTPQLHFEIRKVSSPVDPVPYLDRGPQA